MKKLMIAAAAAAMVSGAFATEYVYDYCASLKTTKGKSGSQTTKYTVNVGMDDAGNYWWDQEDAPWVDPEKGRPEYISPSVAKKYINKQDDETKRSIAAEWLGYDETTGKSAYDNKDIDGKWCFTFTYKVTEGNCYRVAGSTKVTDTIIVDDCCGDNWEFEDGTEIEWGLLYRFGGLTFAKSTKVEAFACWKDEDVEEFYAAGQGTWSDKLVKIDGEYQKGVKNISGNIVGIMANPGCKECCDYPKDALCFECDGTELAADPDTGDSDAEGTAAYGTWSIKFNSKKSFK